MAAMNFGLKNQQAVSTRKPMLKPWGIYKVKFDGVKGDEFKGTKDPSKTYKVLKATFSCKEGAFTETIFYPQTEKDMERMKFENTDKDGKPYTSYGASSYDRAMGFVAQIAATINPEGWKKMQEASDKFQSFDDVVKALIKITEKHIGKETNLKLIGKVKDGAWIAVLPTFVKINRDGESYIADNFIGDALSFTATEESKRKAYLKAEPTTMDDSAEDDKSEDVTVDDTEEEEEIDLDDLDI